jgi:hypothetical protein
MAGAAPSKLNKRGKVQCMTISREERWAALARL